MTVRTIIAGTIIAMTVRARNDRARQWRSDRDDRSRGGWRDHGDRYDNRRRDGH